MFLFINLKEEEVPGLPELFPGLDVFTGKESDVWESKVLVRREDSTSEQVRLAHVVQEAAGVSIETGIDAVEIFRLEGKRQEVRGLN